MKKEEFFNILSKRLSVIEENELNDILSEYKQHIEFKMQSGVDEETAIADFGNIDRLVEDILSAYHVRNDYDNKKSKNFYSEKSKNIFDNFMIGVKSICKNISMYINSLLKVVVNFSKKLTNKILSIFNKDTDKNIQNCDKENDLKKSTSTSKTKPNSIFFKIGSKLNRLFHFMGVAIMRTLLLFYNIFVDLVGFITGIFALISILLFGTSLVLLFQNFPFVGVSIVLLGLSMTLTALTLLIFTFAIKKIEQNDIQESTNNSETSENNEFYGTTENVQEEIKNA